jgi:hypothetical protein
MTTVNARADSLPPDSVDQSPPVCGMDVRVWLGTTTDPSLTWQCAGELAQAEDLLWFAALGIIGDKACLAELKERTVLLRDSSNH